MHRCVSSDLEHKPDIVWPHSEQIIISAVSECGSFMAMGLKTGTVVVWDVYRGESSNSQNACNSRVFYATVLHLWRFISNKRTFSLRARKNCCGSDFVLLQSFQCASKSDSPWHLSASCIPYKQSFLWTQISSHLLPAEVSLTFSAGRQPVFTSRINVLNWTFW